MATSRLFRMFSSAAGGNAGDGLMGMLTKLLPGMDVNALVQKVAPPKG